MELLVFGKSGTKVLFFPPRMGRFYDYENWRVIKSMQEKIEAGYLQIFCLDSIDTETFYNKKDHPDHRICRHNLFESYVLNEVFPFMGKLNSNPNIIAAGCSLGAFHAVNIAMRHPTKFCKVVGMSGRYDLTFSKAYYDDLMSGFYNDNVYYNMPTQYLKNIEDQFYIKQINKMDIVIVIGKQDLFLENNYRLKSILDSKGISYQFYEWDGEAHKAYYWRQMVKFYI